MAGGERIPVLDFHCDLPWEVERTGYDPLVPAPGHHLDLPRLREGGVAVLGTVIDTPEEEAAPDRAPAYAARLLAIIGDLVARSGGALHRVATPAEVGEALRRPEPGRTALLLTMEGVAPLAGDAGALERFHGSGVRLVGLTHNPRNAAGDGTGVPAAERTGALTAFGKDLVRRMGDLGIVPDIAHLAGECCPDLFAAARGPVVCTHAGVRAVADHWRSLSDDQVRAVAATGGVVGIDAYPPHIRGAAGEATLEDIARNLEHVASLVGVRHAALGADFCGFDGPAVRGFEDVSRYPALEAFLGERGWSREDVEGVFWRNGLRVLEEAGR